MIGRHMYVLLLSMCVFSLLLKKYFGPTAQHWDLSPLTRDLRTSQVA